MSNAIRAGSMALKQLRDRLVRFVGGTTGRWRVLAVRPVQGDILPLAERIICLYAGTAIPHLSAG